MCATVCKLLFPHPHSPKPIRAHSCVCVTCQTAPHLSQFTACSFYGWCILLGAVEARSQSAHEALCQIPVGLLRVRDREVPWHDLARSRFPRGHDALRFCGMKSVFMAISLNLQRFVHMVHASIQFRRFGFTRNSKFLSSEP